MPNRIISKIKSGYIWKGMLTSWKAVAGYSAWYQNSRDEFQSRLWWTSLIFQELKSPLFPKRDFILQQLTFAPCWPHWKKFQNLFVNTFLWQIYRVFLLIRNRYIYSNYRFYMCYIREWCYIRIRRKFTYCMGPFTLVTSSIIRW